MKKWILPIAAILIAAAAYFVIKRIPSGNETIKTSETYPGRNAEGDIVNNVLEFTAKEAGIFPYSCWMGMIKSTIEVTE